MVFGGVCQKGGDQDQGIVTGRRTDWLVDSRVPLNLSSQYLGCPYLNSWIAAWISLATTF